MENQIKALANGARLEIIRALENAPGGEMSIEDIAAELQHMEYKAVQAQVAALCAALIVTKVKHGVYRLDRDCIRRIAETIKSLCPPPPTATVPEKTNVTTMQT